MFIQAGTAEKTFLRWAMESSNDRALQALGFHDPLRNRRGMDDRGARRSARYPKQHGHHELGYQHHQHALTDPDATAMTQTKVLNLAIAIACVAAALAIAWRVNSDLRQARIDTNFAQRMMFPDAPAHCWPNDGGESETPFDGCYPAPPAIGPTGLVPEPEITSFITNPPLPTRHNFPQEYERWLRTGSIASQ
jgi:hypothetical protein